MGLATHCVVGQVRPTLGQQSACTVSLHYSQPLACRGPLSKYTVSLSYKQGLQPAQPRSSSALKHPSHLVRCFCSSLLPGTSRVSETLLQASFHSLPGQAPGWVESSTPPAVRWGHCEDTGSSPPGGSALSRQVCPARQREALCPVPGGQAPDTTPPSLSAKGHRSKSKDPGAIRLKSTLCTQIWSL